MNLLLALMYLHSCPYGTYCTCHIYIYGVSPFGEPKVHYPPICFLVCFSHGIRALRSSPRVSFEPSFHPRSGCSVIQHLQPSSSGSSLYLNARRLESLSYLRFIVDRHLVFGGGDIQSKRFRQQRYFEQ